MYACVYHELTVVSISMAWRVMSRIINQSCKNTVPEANSYKTDLLCHILACSGSWVTNVFESIIGPFSS